MAGRQTARTGLVGALRHGALGQTHGQGAGVAKDTDPDREQETHVVAGLVPFGGDELRGLRQPPGHGLAEQFVDPVGEAEFLVAEAGVQREGPAVLQQEGRGTPLRLVRDGTDQLVHGTRPREADPHPALDVEGVPEPVGEVLVREGGDPRAHLSADPGVQCREVALHELGELPGEVPPEQRVTVGAGLDECGGVLHDRGRAVQPGQVVGPIGDVAGVAALHRVVEVVVRENRDPAGPDARLDGERLVAAHRQVLGKAQPVLLHQLPAEELGVRQGERQLRAEEVDVGIVPLVELLVHIPAVGSDHLADDHVGVVLVRTRHHARQGFLAQVVVGTDEVDVPPGGHVQGTVARCRRTSGVLLVDDLDGARVLGREAVQFGTAPVGGPVVHGDDLEPAGTDALPHQ